MTRWLAVALFATACTGSDDLFRTDSTDSTDTTDDTDTAELDPCAAPVSLDLSALTLPTSGSTQSVGGVDLAFSDHAGGFEADLDTFQCLWIHPGQMTAELGCLATQATVPDASSFGAAGNAAFVGLRSGVEVARFDSTGANPETYTISDATGFDTLVLTAGDGIYCELTAE
ncbi:MAG: hypothetical protein AB8H79_22050 [Myxococcota bacterium]